MFGEINNSPFARKVHSWCSSHSLKPEANETIIRKIHENNIIN